MTAAQLGWSVTRGFNEVLTQSDWTFDKLKTISEQIDKEDPFCLVLTYMWTQTDVGGDLDPGIPPRAEVLDEWMIEKRTPYVAYPSAMAQEAAHEGGPMDEPEAQDRQVLGTRLSDRAEQEAGLLDGLHLEGFPDYEQKRRAEWLRLPRCYCINRRQS